MRAMKMGRCYGERVIELQRIPTWLRLLCGFNSKHIFRTLEAADARHTGNMPSCYAEGILHLVRARVGVRSSNHYADLTQTFSLAMVLVSTSQTQRAVRAKRFGNL